jgi:dipeptidyl aminopeptidase/acylaminoacyl peptidase
MRRLFLTWLGAIGLLLAGPAVPQTPDPLAEALALPHASGLSGARDAPLFAWVESRAGARNVWVGGPNRPGRALTSYAADDGQQLHGLALSPNGEQLAYVRGGDEEQADDEDLPNAGLAAFAPSQTVHVVATAGGAPQPIGDGHSPSFSPAGNRLAFTNDGAIWLWQAGTRARRLAKLQGDVSRLTWSPDGRRLLFTEAREENGYVGLLDLASGKLIYLDPGLGQSVEPVFSPDARQVAFIRFLLPPLNAPPESGPYWSIRVADAATGAGRELWAAPAGAGARYYGTRSRNLFWSRDGRLIFPWERTGWLHVYAIDAARGGAPRPLTSGDHEVETFLLDREGEALIYAANALSIDAREVWRRPLSGGAAVRAGPGETTQSYPTIAGDVLAVIATGADRPAYPALLGRSLQPLRPPARIASAVLPEAVTLPAEDGVQVRGQLFRGRGCTRCPAIVYVHGGPRRQMLLGFHPSSYYSKAYALNQRLAARGYHVLAVNYRGGTGYGLPFRDAPGTGRDGASEYHDIMAGGRWLAARADVDPARIGIWGGSWGGYLAALALARNSDLFVAGVDLHGVHSLLRPVATSLSPAAQERARQLQWTSSPLADIDRWRSPVLLVHGDDDRNVPFSQSVLLARELAARRIPFEELVLPNERHSFFRHESWLRALRATEAFLDRNVRDRQPKR